MSSPNLAYLVCDKVLLANSWQKTYNGFSIIVPWCEGLGRFAKQWTNAVYVFLEDNELNIAFPFILMSEEFV